MRITSVASTELFGGTATSPRQIIRVSLVNDGADLVHDRAAVLELTVRGPGVDTPVPVLVTELVRGEERTEEVAVSVAAPAVPGAVRPVTAVLAGPAGRWEAAGQLTVAEPGWTMWMVSHFHYDPVWWNTQGQFAQTWPLLPPEDGKDQEVSTAFDIMRRHLDEARKDADYKFVLAEIDYLKPYFDAFPHEREDLLAFIASGRIEIVGGSYNEPNTNLTCAESTIRNAIYGLAFQRQVLGATPTTSWMLDAFGFDPGYPGLMAAAGLTESSWARGPFHQWGPDRSGFGNEKMQFPAEFEWLSPDGQGLLTSYMPNHYSAGWITQHAADLATAQRDAFEQFSQLKPVAATRNVLLPVGGDHVVPSKWATAIHRDWNSRYTWPRFVTAVPSEYFAAVQAETKAAGGWFLPQTRDMNPVYTGKDVTYIDTKQAQRDAEVALLAGERLATAAWLAGAPYPVASLDKAWRLLAFGAHHDAITGTEGDQVYLDLLAGWREAFERGQRAAADATEFLAGLADTASLASEASQRAIVVVNPLSWPRSGRATITLEFAAGAAATLTLAGPSGAARPFLAQGVRRHQDGSLASVTLTFQASEVPAMGYQTYLVTPAQAGAPVEDSCWRDADAASGEISIANASFSVIADPGKGGTLASVTDLRSGTELLAGPGNELVIQDEYATHPRWGEGPWLLCPSGPWHGSAARPAATRAQRCPLGARLIAEFDLDDLRITQETQLWDDSDLVEFRTHVDGSIGQDRLLRVRFAADVPGGLPVFQTGLSVIGRSPGPAESDVAEHTYTLDNPAHEWFGIGATARVVLAGPDAAEREHAIGVAEVITPAGPAADRFAPRDAGSGQDPLTGGNVRHEIRELLLALARQGVTATCSVPAGARYGSIEIDSNLPDVRIAIGGPEQNAFSAQALAAAGPAALAELARQLGTDGTARIWLPAASSRADSFTAGADLRGSADLPVLVLAGDDLAGAIKGLIADLADARIEVSGTWLAGKGGSAGLASEPSLAPHTVALLNRGLPGSLVTPAGEAWIALMRACSAWPAGIWMDGPKRTMPDGSSFAWQHWSHTFEYALAAGLGDWRSAGFAAAGQEYNHGLLTCETGLHDGPRPASASLAGVTPASAGLMTMKPRGNPLAPHGQPDPADGVLVRLRDLAGPEGGQAAAVRLSAGVAAARLTDLLEERDGQPARCEGDTVSVRVPPRGTVSLVVRPADPGPPGREAEQVPELAQPVFTRYWLHGKGPAPAGNLPVAVHLSPALLVLRPGEEQEIKLTVACGPDPAAGIVSLDIPAGLALVSPDPADLSYALGPRGFAAWDLRVRGTASTPGRYFVAARITDQAGQVLEDAVPVSAGVTAPPVPASAELTELVPALEAAVQAEEAEAELTLTCTHLELAPGGTAAVTARLDNRTASELRGEAQLISPHGSWPAVPRWVTSFAAPAGGSAELSFDLTIPAAERPGQRWWALVKVMYFGRLRYSDPVWISVTADNPAR